MVRQRIEASGLILTFLIVVLAVVAYSFPRISSFFVYDRQAILSGELWRLLTAPLVHFSASHFFWDVLVFGLAGFAINAFGFRSFWLVCSFASIVPGLIYLLTLPELECYGGLSGLATGAVAYLCLCSVFKARKNRMIWLFILFFVAMKIAIEARMGSPIFAQIGKTPFRVLPSAHVLGYLGALVTIVCTWSSKWHDGLKVDTDL